MTCLSSLELLLILVISAHWIQTTMNQAVMIHAELKEDDYPKGFLGCNYGCGLRGFLQLVVICIVVSVE